MNKRGTVNSVYCHTIMQLATKMPEPLSRRPYPSTRYAEVYHSRNSSAGAVVKTSATLDPTKRWTPTVYDYCSTGIHMSTH
ncbi:hypothetical protein PR003_g27320 [Phytophthora rubi]|uniref:Uncharacterized protein n=1 Tax=Phytophthora rubi TaxID=129364 RepID=A0A6A4C0P6_9STRA|nr:hypothetical protein PR003_g27320 [Phytophthora rubi]